MRNFSDLDTNQFLYHCKNWIVFISKHIWPPGSDCIWATVTVWSNIKSDVSKVPNIGYRISGVFGISGILNHVLLVILHAVGFFELAEMCDLSPRKWDYDHLQSFFVSYRVLPGPCFRSFRLPFLTHPNHRQMLTCLHTRYIRITYPCTWTSILEFKGSTLAEIKCARESVWWIVEFDNLDQN